MPARSQILAAASLLLATFPFAAPALALDAQQKQEMGAFIREYLIENPEVMIEVQAALEAKQQAERAAQASQAVTLNRDALFSSKSDVTLGNPQGDVTIVEFFDYNCGYCKRALADMEEIIAKDPEVRFVLKEFPILGPDSLAAHQVSNAVRLLAPEKYPQFHRTLLGSPGMATEETAIDLARSLGLAEKDIRQSMEKSPNDDLVREAYQLATTLGITGTPTYVVGDEALFGAVGSASIQRKIANVRACGKATC